MGIRIKFVLDVSLSENSAGGKDLGSTPSWTGTNDNMDDGGTFRRRFAGSSTDVLVDLNGLSTGRFIAIKTTQTITIKKNATSGEAWTIQALGTGATDGIMIITTNGVTALYISVPGTTAAEVTFSLAGTM